MIGLDGCINRAWDEEIEDSRVDVCGWVVFAIGVGLVTQRYERCGASSSDLGFVESE